MISSKNKHGVILFETILSIALFFIILSFATQFTFKLQEKSKRVNYQSVALLKLEATKQFLNNNKNFQLLNYSDEKLFYNGDLLLDGISKYTLSLGIKVATIDICIDQNKVCQKWKIRV
jgi:hypothetical protein